MSDFDFDEIDKAVTGALSADASTQSTTVSEAPAASRPVLNLSESEHVSKAVPAPASVASTQPEVTSAATPSESKSGALAARRSSGRFMDVVHPSSDMRTRVAFTAPISATQPAAEIIPANTTVEKEQTEQPQEYSQWDAPLESPFLPDAKVEKRPLGGIASNEEPSLLSLLEETDDQLKIEAPDELLLEAHAMPDPIDFAAHAQALPSENEDTGLTATPFESPAVAEAPSEIITTEVPEVAESVEVVPPNDTPETPQAFETAETHEEAKVEEIKPEAPSQVVPETVGPTSITQQYTEQPSSEQPTGSMYDTEAYHQPFAAVAKKHSNVWKILWIILIVSLGGAAGVAFFLFVLPNFGSV